jgi:hypothetical protein
MHCNKRDRYSITSSARPSANVKSFQPIDAYNIFVLGVDGNLWLDTWPVPPPNTPGFNAWGDVQETIRRRRQVDANVAAFQAIDRNTVFVLGKDGNLWLETSSTATTPPWGNLTQTINTRQHIDGIVEAFNTWLDEHNTLGDWVVFVKDTDHVLWYETSPIPPSTTWIRPRRRPTGSWKTTNPMLVRRKPLWSLSTRRSTNLPAQLLSPLLLIAC